MTNLSTKSIKVLKTFNVYFSFLVLGLCTTILGPSLIDLMHAVNTDIQHITLIFASKSFTSICGSMISGILFDSITKRQAALTFITLLLSASIFSIPWSRNLGTIIGLMATLGISVGLLTPGENICIIDLWGENSKPFFQAFHFSYSTGCLIAPLIASPFLQNYNNSSNLGNSSSPIMNQTNLQILTENSISNSIPTVTYAFAIIGIMAIINTFGFLFISIVSPIDENNQKGKISTSGNTNLTFTLILVSLGFILISVTIGAEIGYSQMLTTYATKSSLQLKTTTGSYMTSVFYFSLAIARLISIFLSVKFSSLALIVTNLSVTMLGLLILFFLGAHYEYALWISSVLLGVGISCTLPATISLIEKHIITNKFAAAFDVGGAISCMIIPNIISQFIDTNANVFIYTCLVCWITAVIVTSILYVLLKSVPSKYATKEK